MQLNMRLVLYLFLRVPGFVAAMVCSQHGWWVDGPSGNPYDASRKLGANIYQVVDTTSACRLGSASTLTTAANGPMLSEHPR
jgi:hypothetical protein